MRGLYDRQKELTQDAIEELRTRRARIELAAEALQEAQQRRTEAREQQEDKQRVQNATQVQRKAKVKLHR